MQSSVHLPGLCSPSCLTFICSCSSSVIRCIHDDRFESCGVSHDATPMPLKLLHDIGIKTGESGSIRPVCLHIMHQHICLYRYGKAGVQFFTNTKTVTTNWKSADEAIGTKAPGLAGVGTDL